MKRIHYIYLTTLFVGFHFYLTIYINSSFLSRFIPTQHIGLLYIAGAFLNILFFILVPKLLRNVQLKSLALTIISIEFLVFLVLSQTHTKHVAFIFFILGQSVGPLISYCLDLFLEAEMRDEKSTGTRRAYFLTALNISLVISFAIVSYLAPGSFSPIYLLSAVMLLPASLIMLSEFNKHIHKTPYINIRSAVLFISRDFDVLRILASNFILQFFYSLMIIYLPLFLNSVIGFNWQEIGLILIVMILPFLIFEIPVGRIIDKKTGEKEFLFIGFIVMGAACLSIAFIDQKLFWLWALILFISRIGAALVEISNESYFFKKVNERHPSIISLFRITQPLALLVGSSFAVITLFFTSYSILFGLLGFICLLGLTTIPKIDTK